MNTIFITGAEGFTGRRLVAFLKSKGFQPIAGVRNRARKLAFERQSTRSLVCDVSDSVNVARAIASANPQAVIHLAGMTQAHQAAIDPLSAYQSIVSGWANVLDAVRRSCPRARVLLASACDVYGCAGNDGVALTEETPLQPTNTFGSLKATAESAARSFFENYHLNVTIVRPFHYVGPSQSESFFFASIASQLAAGTTGDALRLTDLSCVRDLLHVDDVVSAYHTLIEHGEPNEVYNVATGRSHTVRQIVEKLIQLSGRSVRLEEQPADAGDEGVRFYRGDSAKLHALGWSPKHDLDAALRDLFGSFKGDVHAQNGAKMVAAGSHPTPVR